MSMHLDPLVRRGSPAAFIVGGEPTDLVALQRALDRAHPDTNVVHVRGAKMRTTSGFFDELAAALQFPVWFGANEADWVTSYDQLRRDVGFAIALKDERSIVPPGDSTLRVTMVPP